jgi:hypothetical protein
VSLIQDQPERDQARLIESAQPPLEELPSYLVVGTGADGRMRPGPDTILQLQQRGVTVEALPTGQAVRRFGERTRHALRPPSTSPANPATMVERIPVG